MRHDTEAIYRKVNPADFGRLEGKRNQVARDVYAWLCIGTDSTMSGLRRASPAQLAESLGWSIPSVKIALQHLHDAGMIVWSPEVSVAYTFTARREPAQNERHCKGLKRDTSWCPPCAAKSQAIDDIGDRRDRVSDTVSDTVSHTSTQDAGCRMQDTEISNVADAPAPVKPTRKKREPAVTIAPELETTIECFRSFPDFTDDYLSDAESCHWHYAKNAFCMNNGKPLKDWMATCRQWWTNAKPGGKYHTPRNQTPRRFVDVSLQQREEALRKAYEHLESDPQF